MTPPSPARAHRSRHHRGLGLSAAAVLVAAVAGAFIAITPAAATILAPSSDASNRPAAASDDLEQWLWPVPAPIRVVSPFRAPPSPYAAGHRGIDVATVPGSTVVAAADGVVSFAGSVAGRGVVAIDHGGGVVSAIEPVEPAVVEGATVAAGDVIGTVATGGHCASECVHFGVRIDGAYVSPFLFLGGLPRAVLLPMP